jgi:hypothetical protein
VTRLDRFPVHSSGSTTVNFQLTDRIEGGFVGGTFIEDGEVASVSFVKIECDGLFGPELILRGESFNGDKDLFRSYCKG